LFKSAELVFANAAFYRRLNALRRTREPAQPFSAISNERSPFGSRKQLAECLTWLPSEPIRPCTGVSAVALDVGPVGIHTSVTLTLAEND